MIMKMTDIDTSSDLLCYYNRCTDMYPIIVYKQVENVKGKGKK